MFSAVYITLCFIYQVDQAPALPADNADSRRNFLSYSDTSFILVIADDISFLDGSKENADMLFSFTYHTHHIFLNNRETTDFS